MDESLRGGAPVEGGANGLGLTGVGVIGVGAMGLPLALRLAERGHRVMATDTDPARRAAAEASGLQTLPDAAGLARRCECLVVVVVNAEQVREALFGAGGAFDGATGSSAARARRVVLCPTLGPADVEAVGERLAALGVACVEAPMSGGPRRARDGSMSLMVAGAPEAVQAEERLLADLSDRLVRLGPRLGDGARVKLVNNLLAAAHLAAAAEAMALAQRVGLEPATVLDVLERSSGQSWIASDRLRRWLAAGGEAGAASAGPEPGSLPVHAALALLAKDTRLAAEMAEAAGLPLAITAPAVQAFAAAARDGREGWDDAHLVDWVRGRG